ncbi:Nuclear pore complex protein nup96 [Salvia divinorum]|uniref:Nuclear pore complex protein nup96 n=1 Tax=Salvia divinorum TaxID=28513 RepID=A0ABD1I8F6_SALDI
MLHHEDYPYLQATVIREILFQYCEVWSTRDSQLVGFIEGLGILSAWLHEALAIFYSYTGDLSKALDHFLACAIWQKAHSVFLTSVAPSLFLSSKHAEIWTLATSMEDYESETEDWDLGAVISVSFYILKNSIQEENSTMTELDTLENKNDACSKLEPCSQRWQKRSQLFFFLTATRDAVSLFTCHLSELAQ